MKLLGGEGETKLVAPRTTKQYPQTILRVLKFPNLVPHLLKVYTKYMPELWVGISVKSHKTGARTSILPNLELYC